MESLRNIPAVARALECRCDVVAVRELCREARKFLSGLDLTDDELDAWELALAEAANNAVEHVRPDCGGQPLKLNFLATQKLIEARLTDHTPGFEFPENPELPSDDSETGRGLFLIRNLVDEVEYLRGSRENCLVLRRNRHSPCTPPANAEQQLVESRQTLDAMTEELASCYESLSAIFRFSAELQDVAASDEAIARWLHQLLTAVEADWFVLRLADDSRSHLDRVITSLSGWQPGIVPLTDSNSVEVRAAVSRSDVWFDGRTPLAPSDPVAATATSGCGFAHAIFAGEALIGVLTLGRYGSEHLFEAAQVNVCHTFADFLGLQIRSTRAQQEQVRARLDQRDLEIAANIQRALLPQQLPQVPHAAIAAYYRSARQIGGDYYDVLPTPDGNLLLIVADVMGKGLPAALFSMMFRSLVRARRELAPTPGEFLSWLNVNLFAELDQAEMFITAQFAYLDCHRGEICVASAGHPPMLIIAGDGTMHELASDGPPLGISRNAVFAEQRLAYPHGRALMFTDGLIEAREPRGDMLGLAAVKAALIIAASSGETCEATRERLVQMLETFEQGVSPADDTAFLVIAGKATT